MLDTVLIITGMSGSGKSIAVKALEDLGFFCADNLPVVMLPQFLSLLKEGTQRVAVVVDARQPGFGKNNTQTFKAISEKLDIQPQIIFLDCEDQMLTRRFSESRRPHPLSDLSAAEGIQKERILLRSFREAATLRIDTSNLAPHQLRHRLRTLFAPTSENSPLQITFLSFGFKHGIPPDADIVLDVRFLPNPYWVKPLRKLNGEDAEVISYLEKQKDTHEFLKRSKELLKFMIESFQQSDRHYLTIAIGCTGGQHRSVYTSRHLRDYLKETLGTEILLLHRDRKKENLNSGEFSVPAPDEKTDQENKI